MSKTLDILINPTAPTSVSSEGMPLDAWASVSRRALQREERAWLDAVPRDREGMVRVDGSGCGSRWVRNVFTGMVESAIVRNGGTLRREGDVLIAELDGGRVYRVSLLVAAASSHEDAQGGAGLRHGAPAPLPRRGGCGIPPRRGAAFLPSVDTVSYQPKQKEGRHAGRGCPED